MPTKSAVSVITGYSEVYGQLMIYEGRDGFHIIHLPTLQERDMPEVQTDRDVRGLLRARYDEMFSKFFPEMKGIGWH